MSGPAGASTNFPGAGASVYTPNAQGTADTGFQNIASNFYNQYMGGQTPGQMYGPQVSSAVNSLFGNPYAQGAQGAAGAVDTFGQPFGYSNLVQGQNLQGAAAQGLSYLPNVLGNAFNPAYGAVSSQMQQNPFYSQALAGAQQGAGIGAGVAGQAAGAVPGLFGAANQTLATGFDPQNALFNRTQQQVLDQSNAVNSMSGVGSTPYGAGITGQNLSNFDINWQNNLLGRQAQAGSAAQGLDAAGLALGSGASSLANSSAAMPSTAFTNQLGNVLSALNAQNNAGNVGANAFGSLLGGSGAGLTSGANLGNSGLGTILSSGQAPYNTASTIGGNQLSALGQGINLGNQQYALPQQLLNDLESYLRLGQSSSNISGNLGNMGFNQLGQGIGGGISAANSLFGSNGMLSGGGGGLGGLFGGAGGGGDFGGGGAALGIPDSVANATGASGGIGEFLSSAAPFAASA